MEVDKPLRKRGRPMKQDGFDKVAVLNAALKVFAENGYLGSQQKDIAQLAGVSSPLLSYHFKNKEDIWKQAIHMISEDLRNRLAQTRRFLKDLKGIPLLKAYNRQIYYLFAEHPNFAKILLQEMGTDTWRAEYLTEHIFNLLIKVGGETIGEAMESTKEFSRIPVHLFLPLLVGSATAPIMLQYLIKNEYGHDALDLKYIEKHADLFNELIYDNFEKNS